MEKYDISYFRDLLSKNVLKLENLCEEWEKNFTDSTLSEGVLGEIRSTIGLAKLLIQQKLNQFRGLIHDSEFKKGEKEITCIDLQGFWDMVYYEVEKILRRFDDLEKCKKNNWQFVEKKYDELKLKKSSINPVPKQVVPNKSHTLAARQRLLEAKRRIQLEYSKQKKEDFTVEILEPAKQKSNLISKNTVKNQKNENNSLNKKENIKMMKKKDICLKKATDLLNEVTASNRYTELGNCIEHEDSKNSATQNKENVADVSKYLQTKIPGPKSTMQTAVSFSSSAQKKKANLQEVIPLQCVTRSARRALLKQQNTL